MYVSENGIKHLIWGKIQPTEPNLSRLEQAFWNLQNIGKVMVMKQPLAAMFF